MPCSARWRHGVGRRWAERYERLDSDATDPPAGPAEPASATPQRVRTAARGAAAAGARLVLCSSDLVFDGRHGPYTEDDPPDPADDAGRAALESEQVALAAPCDTLVVRTSLLFGWSRTSGNLAMQVWSRVGAGLRLTVDDALHTPTLAEYLAEATVRLLEMGARGIVHVAGRDLMSRCDVARHVARALLLDSALIEPVQRGTVRPRRAASDTASRPDGWLRCSRPSR